MHDGDEVELGWEDGANAAAPSECSAAALCLPGSLLLTVCAVRFCAALTGEESVAEQWNAARPAGNLPTRALASISSDLKRSGTTDRRRPVLYQYGRSVERPNAKTLTDRGTMLH